MSGVRNPSARVGVSNRGASGGRYPYAVIVHDGGPIEFGAEVANYSSFREATAHARRIREALRMQP